MTAMPTETPQKEQLLYQKIEVSLSQADRGEFVDSEEFEAEMEETYNLK